MIQKILAELKVKPIVNYDLEKAFVFDFTETNLPELQTQDFTKKVFDKLTKNKTQVGLGKYVEDRSIYRRSKLFDSPQGKRSIHLGIDIFAKPKTPIFAPIAGTVHSFQNNDAFGDYGPTIILQHNISSVIFYTLYGHLTLDSLNLKVGDRIVQGQEFARIGEEEINGNWPPHLHFQIITDLLGKKGDFPGVAAPLEKEKYLALCPNPNLLLRVKKLQ